MNFRLGLLGLLMMFSLAAAENGTVSVLIPKVVEGQLFNEIQVDASNPTSEPARVRLHTPNGFSVSFELAPGRAKSFSLLSYISFWMERITVQINDGPPASKNLFDVRRGKAAVFFSGNFTQEQLQAFKRLLALSSYENLFPVSGDWSRSFGLYLGCRALLFSREVFATLPVAVRNAVLDYARLGGTLVIVDPGRKSAARRVFGFGSVVEAPQLPENEPPFDPAAWRKLEEAQGVTTATTSFFMGTPGGFLGYRITLHQTGIWCLMFVFVLAGACTWRILVRRGKGVHLFWILPAGSLLFSGAVLLVAGFGEGWSARYRAATVTFLDQCAGRSVSVGQVSFYAPLWGMEPLVFPERQVVTPVATRRNAKEEILPDRGVSRWRGVTWGRMPGCYLMFRGEARPERLEVRELGDGRIELVNRLGIPITELRLVGTDRRIYQRNEVLQPGEKVLLTGAESVKRQDLALELPVVFDYIVRQESSPYPRIMYPGRYVARMVSRTPFLSFGTERAAEREESWLIGEFAPVNEEELP